MWRSQRRCAREGRISSRTQSESATSRGSRSATTKDGSRPRSARISTHSGASSESRGSFTSHRASPANCSSIRFARATRVLWMAGARVQPSGRGRIPSQVVPRPCSTSSCRRTTSASSQNPVGLSAWGGSRPSPTATPSRFNVRAIAEVPLRCMPSTRIGRDSAGRLICGLWTSACEKWGCTCYHREPPWQIDAPPLPILPAGSPERPRSAETRPGVTEKPRRSEAFSSLLSSFPRCISSLSGNRAGSTVQLPWTERVRRDLGASSTRNAGAWGLGPRRSVLESGTSERVKRVR